MVFWFCLTWGIGQDVLAGSDIKAYFGQQVSRPRAAGDDAFTFHPEVLKWVMGVRGCYS